MAARDIGWSLSECRTKRREGSERVYCVRKAAMKLRGPGDSKAKKPTVAASYIGKGSSIRKHCESASHFDFAGAHH